MESFNAANLVISLLVMAVGALSGILLGSLKKQVTEVQEQQTFQLKQIVQLNTNFAVVDERISTFNRTVEKSEKQVESIKEKVDKVGLDKITEYFGKVLWLQEKVIDHEKIHKITLAKLSKDGR